MAFFSLPSSTSPVGQVLYLCAPFLPSLLTCPLNEAHQASALAQRACALSATGAGDTANMSLQSPQTRDVDPLSCVIEHDSYGLPQSYALEGSAGGGQQGRGMVGFQRPADASVFLQEGERLRDCLPTGLLSCPGELRWPQISTSLPCAFLSWREMMASPPAPALASALGD